MVSLLSRAYSVPDMTPHFSVSSSVQGLELDGNGRVYLRPQGNDLQQVYAEQEAWGASSEKATHAFLENLAITGARAAGNAGVLPV